MALTQMRIGIIGAGIAGLTSAIALTRRGADVEIFEQAEDFAEVGAGIQISANALRVLTDLGIDLKDAIPCGTPQAVNLRGARGMLLSRTPLNTQPDHPYYQVHRADFIALLAEQARAAGVTLNMGQPALADGGAGSIRINGVAHDFDLVVAADGVRSPTRMAFLDGIEPAFTGQVAWRALVPMPQGAEVWRDTNVYMGLGRHVVFYGLRDQTLLNIVAVERRKSWTAEGWDIPDSGANMRAHFLGFSADVRAALDQVTAPKLWGLFDHPPLNSWSRGNLVVVGDAAHPMLPYMAQGACMGIEDAWVLADSLDQTTEIPSALQRYEMLRKPRCSALQRAAKSNGRLFHISNPLARRTATVGLKITSTLAPGLLRRRTDWIYNHDVTRPL
ncbi:monooxygenase [Amylibacter marinus]|uniref:Monooxygenase n=1 Tax=Amylibacter marinus TaxID=1475483 RepID=A0ABQ5VTU9_9RHOB|nr:FAD-dependent monooxygenase [Amylibacter marinus]GLQ34816.1 monooxygenase [Amylibacter marinus]